VAAAEAARRAEVAAAAAAKRAAAEAEFQAELASEEEKRHAAQAAAAAREAAVASAASGGGGRELLLMVLPNELLPSARKVKCRAQDMDELLVQVVEKLGLEGVGHPSQICLAPAVPSGQPHAPFASLEQLAMKAKVQVWPIDSAAATADDAGSAPTRDVQLMVMPSDLVASTRKLKLTVHDLPDLLAQASASLGLPRDLSLTLHNSPAAITSLAELGDKAKVQLWAAAASSSAAAPSEAARELLLMIMPSELVVSSRKFKCSATDLADVLTQASAKFQLPADVFLSRVVPAGEAPVPLTSIDELQDKDKIQIWPATALGADDPASAAAAAAAAAVVVDGDDDDSLPPSVGEYRALLSVPLRSTPSFDAAATGSSLVKGEAFAVVERREVRPRCCPVKSPYGCGGDNAIDHIRN
jgi:hypothetical protein